MAEPIVIAATRKSIGGQGEYPVRFVVLKWQKWTQGVLSTKEYSRHMQVFDGVHEDYFIYGHYYCEMKDAMDDLVRSVKENNRDYPEGNVSHIPAGLDFFNSDLIDR